MYCIVNWIKGEEGFWPDLPEDISFLVLADPHRGASFALLSCDLACDEELPAGVEEVPDELVELLHSAEDYPPALAMTRERIEGDPSADYGKVEFVSLLIDVLTDELQKQPDSSCFLAKATKTQTGYLHAGGYYWIVGYKADEKAVAWVSRDYCVYHDEIDCFDLSKDDLACKFK